jgi:hypothetical protein
MAVLLAAVVTQAQEARYSWQKPHAKVLSNGDIQWAPEPYAFRVGQEVRYIDYEGGDDNADGLTKATAWRHHPWDHDATGKAENASGSITYVFKGGVAYRGQLDADESGKPGNPIRLTWDPTWGKGRAWLWGSDRLPAKWVRASTVKTPERLPEPRKVWALDLKAAGFEVHDDGITFTRINLHPAKGQRRRASLNPTYIGLFQVSGDGDFRTMHLARTPDWQPMGENFAMDYWHTTDAEVRKTDSQGRRIAGGFKDDIWAGKGLPPDYFTGGYIWMGYRSLMGTPTPSPITERAGKKGRGYVPYFDPEEGSLMKWAAPYGHGKGNLPYMIENLPQFLDAPGEFYYDPATGHLFLRLEERVDPNDLHLELANDIGSIQIHSQGHIELAGLGFAFAQGSTIKLQNDVQDVNIHHCVFRKVLDEAIRGAQDLRAQAFYTMDKIRIADCEFTDIGTTAIRIAGSDSKWGNREAYKDAHRGDLAHVDILRNRTYQTGIRHRGLRWSNVPAISVTKLETGEFAGNVIRRSFGSGLVIFGGKNSGHGTGGEYEEPLVRVLVHHNKTEDTALGVNDYGGLALWQGGPTYAFCNNIGNSPGHMPAGLFGSTRPLNLSYPLYLDGAFKQYCFNNIIWGRSTDKQDPYSNTTPGYFMVFGFLNQFFGNTLYRQSDGIGGSSGNRNDIVGNIFSEVTDTFLASNRIGDPSLAGGGDNASSGLRGIPTLAYARNVFHGPAEAGYLIREKERERTPTIDKLIHAQSIDELAKQMQAFPIRVGSLGDFTPDRPIMGAPEAKPITELTEQISFRPTPDSAAIDAGGIYFVPWSLYGTVGEWNFTENHADPTVVVDYHFYFSEAHYHRMMYEQIPSHDLHLNRAGEEIYLPGTTENWVRSAMHFDGNRYGAVKDAFMRKPISINLGMLDRASRRSVPVPGGHWNVPSPSGGKKFTLKDVMTYPGQRRKTLIITTQNLLMEAIVKVEKDHGGCIAGKHDGRSGYQLRINDRGKAEFIVASEGSSHSVVAEKAIADGKWHHVLAQIDRATGAMDIYVDGRHAGRAKASLATDASLDCKADFMVAKASAGQASPFIGAIDFLRVCRGTLDDSRTTIEELYEWQTNGPHTRDFLGRKPQGRRDAGAIEHTK